MNKKPTDRLPLTDEEQARLAAKRAKLAANAKFNRAMIAQSQSDYTGRRRP